jgi:hypothetical protein
VRGTLVVLGGFAQEGRTYRTSSVEILEGGAFADLPPLSLSRGGGEVERIQMMQPAVQPGAPSAAAALDSGISGAAAIAVDDSASAAGQVLLLGGRDEQNNHLTSVQLVDLATGACAPQPGLLHSRGYPAAGRLPDGRIVCAGRIGG